MATDEAGIQPDSGNRAQTRSAPSPRSGEPTHRMLAAVIRQGDKAWFFKGVAGVDQFADGLSGQFTELIESVKFSPDGKVSWQLPDGWRQEDAQGMRFATLHAGDVEFSVIPLPVPDGDETQYLLSNIVRWRDQLQLPPITADQLDDETQQIDLGDGAPATVVDLRGWQGPDEMRSLFAGSRDLPANHPPVGSGLGANDPAGLTYEVPAGWHETKSGGLRRAAFEVTDGEQEIEVTVIDLAGAAGDLLSNVNRWREQVGLGPLKSVDAIKATKIQVDDKPATYVRIEGTDEPQSGRPSFPLGGVFGLSS